MKLKNLYDAGVELAHEANRVRDNLIAHNVIKETLTLKESEKAQTRIASLMVLGLRFEPEDYQACDSTELYTSSARALAERAKFGVLVNSAALLIDTALKVEESPTGIYQPHPAVNVRII